jgi:hypothetical protein
MACCGQYLRLKTIIWGFAYSSLQLNIPILIRFETALDAMHNFEGNFEGAQMRIFGIWWTAFPKQSFCLT